MRQEKEVYTLFMTHLKHNFSHLNTIFLLLREIYEIKSPRDSSLLGSRC